MILGHSEIFVVVLGLVVVVVLFVEGHGGAVKVGRGIPLQAG